MASGVFSRLSVHRFSLFSLEGGLEWLPLHVSNEGRLVEDRLRNQEGLCAIENSEERFFGLAAGKRQC